MEYGNPITKDTLRDIYDNTPDTPDNRALRQLLVQQLTRKRLQAMQYTYTAIWAAAGAANSLAAGAVNQLQTINIASTGDFLLLNTTYDANTANAARTSGTYVVPNASVNIVEAGPTNWMWSDAPMPVPSIFGNGQFPYVLPQPRLWPSKSTIQVYANNYDAAAGIDLYLMFNGVVLLAAPN